MLNENVFKKILVGVFILILLIIAIVILKPILVSIAWALVLAYIFSPVYNFLLKRIKEKNITALLVVLLVIFILFLPLWFLFPIVTKQIFDVYSYFQTLDTVTILQKILPWFFSSASLQTEAASLINSFVSTLVSTVLSSFSDALLNLVNTALQLVVVIFTFFFALRDGNKLKEYVRDISPLNKTLEKSLSSEFKNITKAVIFGFIVTGVVQGLFTGLGLLIFGVPHSLLLTLLAILVSIIPILGAWLIWIPATIYLLATGHTGAAIGLAIYGAIFISWIDNILRIWLISARTKLSSAIVLIGMIGGLIVFGIIGLFIGPLILSYLIIIIDAYKEKKFSDIFS